MKEIIKKTYQQLETCRVSSSCWSLLLVGASGVEVRG